MVVVLTTPSFRVPSNVQLAHLGSDMSAECLTRPMYVLKSYCEAGRSREPGNEDVMVSIGAQRGAMRAAKSPRACNKVLKYGSCSCG